MSPWRIWIKIGFIPHLQRLLLVLFAPVLGRVLIATLITPLDSYFIGHLPGKVFDNL